MRRDFENWFNSIFYFKDNTLGKIIKELTFLAYSSGFKKGKEMKKIKRNG